jgi:hypothetical protein
VQGNVFVRLVVQGNMIVRLVVQGNVFVRLVEEGTMIVSLGVQENGSELGQGQPFCFHREFDNLKRGPRV